MRIISTGLCEELDRYADRCFVESGGASWLYADVVREAMKRVPAIDQPAVVVNVNVGVEFIFWLIACLIKGSVVVPYQRGKVPIEDIQEQIGAHLLVDSEGVTSIGTKGARPSPFRTGDVYCLFTSGTTSKPKGVVVSERNVSSYLVGMQRVLENAQDVRRSSCLFSPVFDLYFHDFFVAACNGWSLVVPNGTERIDLARFVNSRCLDMWFSTPTHAANCIKRVSGKIRYTLFCGEPLSKSLAVDWATTTSSKFIANLYGPTETTIATTAGIYSPQELELLPCENTVPIGLPFGENLCEVSTDGELLTRGPQLARYLGESSNTAFYIDEAGERVYRTGDLVKWVETSDVGSRLLHLGRKDRQLKINGNRIEAAELERVACAVRGVHTAKIEPLLEAHRCTGFVVHLVGNASEKDVASAFAARFSGTLTPARVQIWPSLPQDTSGKARI